MTTISTGSRTLETNSGVVTSWLPLTTAYPSVSGCDGFFYSVVPNTVAGWDPGFGVNVNTRLHCQPSQVTSWWLSQHRQLRYSIGPLVCPVAYTTAFLSVKDATSTFVACCPTGYKFVSSRDAGNTGECITELVPGQVIVYGVLTDQNVPVWTLSTQALSSSTTAAGIQINGYVFAQIGSASSPHASTPTSASSTKIPGTSSTSSMPTSSTGSRNSSTGLSAGASAGIGVGVGLVTVLALCLAVFCFWRHRRRTKTNLEPSYTEPHISDKQPQKAERRLESELDGTQVYKNPPGHGNELPRELPA